MYKLTREEPFCNCILYWTIKHRSKSNRYVKATIPFLTVVSQKYDMCNLASCILAITKIFQTKIVSYAVIEYEHVN